VPCIPSIPKNCGSFPGKAPRPWSVDVIGNPVNETNSLSNLVAFGPELITPPPVYKIGFEDFLISSITESTSNFFSSIFAFIFL